MSSSNLKELNQITSDLISAFAEFTANCSLKEEGLQNRNALRRARVATRKLSHLAVSYRKVSGNLAKEETSISVKSI